MAALAALLAAKHRQPRNATDTQHGKCCRFMAMSPSPLFPPAPSAAPEVVIYLVLLLYGADPSGVVAAGGRGAHTQSETVPLASVKESGPTGLRRPRMGVPPAVWVIVIDPGGFLLRDRQGHAPARSS